MTTRPRSPRSAYVVAAVADTALAGRGTRAARRLRSISKPALMPLLTWSFLEETRAHAGDPLRRPAAAALILSGVGDAALLRPGERSFLAGVAGFSGAHVAYVWTFAGARRPWSDREHLSGVAAAAATFAVTAPLLGRAASRVSPRLQAPVVAYAGVLCAMVATSTRLDPAIDAHARRTIGAGTALFLVSDSLLAGREFVARRPSPRTRAVLDVAVMSTYTLAQALITHGLARAIGDRNQPTGTTSV